MKKIAFIIVLILAGFGSRVCAQWQPYYPGTMYRIDNADTIDDLSHVCVELPKYEPHLSVTTGFMGTNYGDNRLYTSVAPSLVVRPSKRWTLIGGFRITTDMGLNGNYTFSDHTSLAPYRRNGGTGIAAVGLAAEYQVNENIWLSGSLYHFGGTYAPVYFGNGNVYDVSCTAISAAAAFRFSDDNFLKISFTYLRDNYGTLPLMMHDAWMHSGCYGWGMYSPADYYRMAAYGMPMCTAFGY